MEPEPRGSLPIFRQGRHADRRPEHQGISQDQQDARDGPLPGRTRFGGIDRRPHGGKRVDARGHPRRHRRSDGRRERHPEDSRGDADPANCHSRAEDVRKVICQAEDEQESDRHADEHAEHGQPDAFANDAEGDLQSGCPHGPQHRECSLPLGDAHAQRAKDDERGREEAHHAAEQTQEVHPAQPPIDCLTILANLSQFPRSITFGQQSLPAHNECLIVGVEFVLDQDRAEALGVLGPGGFLQGLQGNVGRAKTQGGQDGRLVDEPDDFEFDRAIGSGQLNHVAKGHAQSVACRKIEHDRALTGGGELSAGIKFEPFEVSVGRRVDAENADG